MTQEEKDLLLKDLCARIPYQPLCKITDTEYDFCECDGPLGYSLRDFVGNNVIIKPYLRPMSSMTEEERLYFYRNSSRVQILVDEEKLITKTFYGYTIHLFDWLNANHFDYHNLIGKGLALKAREGMYKIE